MKTTTASYFKIYHCYACGCFVAKIHHSSIEKNGRVTVTAACSNSRCKTDNVIHIHSGKATVMKPVNFAYELPRILIDMEEEEKVKA